MEPRELAAAIAGILEQKKAEEPRVLEITELTTLADYFVVATGTSSTHLRTLHDEVELHLKKQGILPLHDEGHLSGNWLLSDYGSVVLHLFLREAREFYSIERLWSDAKTCTAEEFISEKA